MSKVAGFAAGLLAISGLTLPTIAAAEGPSFMDAVGSALGEFGIYAGASVGSAMYDLDRLQGVSSVDDKDTGAKGYLGISVTKNIDIEFSYMDLGKISASGLVGGIPSRAQADLNVFSLAGVFNFPVSSQFTLFGKLGAYHSDVDSEANVQGVSYQASDNNYDYTVGVGAKYAFNKNLGARLEWEHFNSVGFSGTTGDFDVNFVSLGIFYKF